MLASVPVPLANLETTQAIFANNAIFRAITAREAPNIIAGAVIMDLI